RRDGLLERAVSAEARPAVVLAAPAATEALLERAEGRERALVAVVGRAEDGRVLRLAVRGLGEIDDEARRGRRVGAHVGLAQGLLAALLRGAGHVRAVEEDLDAALAERALGDADRGRGRLERAVERGLEGLDHFAVAGGVGVERHEAPERAH